MALKSLFKGLRSCISWRFSNFNIYWIKVGRQVKYKNSTRMAWSISERLDWCSFDRVLHFTTWDVQSLASQSFFDWGLHCKGPFNNFVLFCFPSRFLDLFFHITSLRMTLISGWVFFSYFVSNLWFCFWFWKELWVIYLLTMQPTTPHCINW